MSAQKFLRITIAGSLIAALAACGGGGDGGSSDSARTPSPAAQSSFASAYVTGLDALGSATGILSQGFRDLFDAAFLDSGVSKAQLDANLDGEAFALQISPDFPSFPTAKLSDVSISNCDSATGVCTLTGTLTNSDADLTGADTTAVTTVPFTTQVKYGADGKLRLLGDQSKS